jgi:hypothetical protein
MKREFLIYIAVLIVLSLNMHPDFFTTPLQRLENLPTSGAYGLGMIHPFVFALVGYLFVLLVRGIWGVLMKLFGKEETH